MTDFCLADLHLGHHKTITVFKRPDGSPLRDFPDVDTMNNTIIENINKTVTKNDRLFVLGDVVINKKYLPLVDEIKCLNRILVGGNHDLHTTELLKYFPKIYGCIEYHNCILTHIPVAASQRERFKYNIHGHLHFKQMEKTLVDWDDEAKEIISWKVPDTFYKNVCVEMIDYTPVKLQFLAQG